MNLMLDRVSPGIVSKTINAAGTTLTVVFRERVTGVAAADYALSTGQLLSLPATADGGFTWTFTCGTVYSTDAPTLAYTGTATRDLIGNRLPMFSGGSITNNSTQVAQGALWAKIQNVWDFEEVSDGSAPVARVDSKAGYSLSDVNNCPSDVGLIGNAVSMTRTSSQTLSITDVAAPLLSKGDFDFWFFARVMPISTQTMNIFGKWHEQNSWWEYALQWDNGFSAWRWLIMGSSNTLGDVTRGMVGSQLNVWNDLYCWHDSVNNIMGLRVSNGNNVQSTITHSAGCLNNLADFRVGSIMSGDTFGTTKQFWNGKIDQLIGGSTLLTVAEQDYLFANHTTAEIMLASP